MAVYTGLILVTIGLRVYLQPNLNILTSNARLRVKNPIPPL
jgi:hypothetical protein